MVKTKYTAGPHKLDEKKFRTIFNWESVNKPVFRIRIHKFLGLPDLDPDPLVRGMDPDLDPSIIKQK